MTRVVFITGFNRSGTTLLVTAVTEATGASTLTVGQLARHLPSLDRFLTTAKKQSKATDRGVDRLPVNDSTPEEYGWLLHAATGEFAFTPQAAESGVLLDLIDELASDGQAVVLKNPPDTGSEQELLDSFPGSCVLIVRRRLSAIENSQDRAWSRMASSNRYMRALISDRKQAAETLGVLLDPKARQEMVRTTTRKTRRDALSLARGVATLPLDRVAFLSYDELRTDAHAGAAWAAHLVDPGALAQAIETHSFPEYNAAAKGRILTRLVDGYWALSWRRARTRQVKAGLLQRPTRTKPKAEQPQAERPQAEQPQAEQPQAEQPQAEWPQAEQPTRPGQ